MEFPAGSMGPKVQAAVEFAAATGKRAVIGSLDEIDGLVAGTAGRTSRARSQAMTAFGVHRKSESCAR